MLTADLVSARRRGNELQLVALDAAGRERAQAIAGTLIAIAAEHVGRTREDLEEALGAVDVGPREYRLKDGMAKLVEDRCRFGAGDEIAADEVRREVFTHASAVRASLQPVDRFDRRAILAEIAGRRGVTEDAIERALFADLRGAHVLEGFDPLSPQMLVTAYEHGQAQAVLLRAVKVVVDVRCASPGALRAFFHRMKFLRLLHTIEPTEAGHRVVIDGPFSLFESVTKYGMQLASLLPVLEGCDDWRLEADVRWGKDRVPLAFRLAGRGQSTEAEPASALPDEVQAMMRAFTALGTAWRVSPNTEVLQLPGIGLCIPDVVFERPYYGAPRDRVYLEVMGYWSRAAVWKRIELVEGGLAARILFAVSARLRVSEEALDGSMPSALYVYKQAMSARAIAERLEKLAR